MAWPQQGDCGPQDLAVISLLSLCSFVDCQVPRALVGAIKAKRIRQRLIPRPTTKISSDLLLRELRVNTMANDTLQHCPPLPCRHQHNGVALVWHSLLLCQNRQSLLCQHQQNGAALAWHSLLLCQHPLAVHCHRV